MFPELITERLILNKITDNDAEDIVEYANNPEVYATTFGIANPYTINDAKEFIEITKNAFEEKSGYFFAVRLKENNKLIGAIDIRPGAFEKAEIGYAINQKYWGQGYATESLKAVLSFAFNELKLNKISAFHFTNNPASGKVMQKCGMQKEGILKQHIKKEDRFIDCVLYAILKEDYPAH